MGAHKAAIDGGYLLPCVTTKGNEWSPDMQKHEGHRRMLYAVGRRLRGGETVAFRYVLMGLPFGWLELEPLGTHRFQQWLELHGSSSSGE